MAAEDVRTTPFEVPPPPAPPRFTMLDAVRRQLPVAILPVIVLVALAVAAGLARTPVYESLSTLNVGGLNLTSQSVEGYTAAVTQLAIAYSRAVDATPVVRPVAKKLQVPEFDVINSVSATNIQDSSVILIFSKGTDPGHTERLADATADSLVNYAVGLNSGRRAARGQRALYQQASRDFHRAQADLARAPEGSAEARATQIRVDTARLEMETRGFLYQQSQAGQVATELVQKLTPAKKAKSDRADVTQQYAGGAAVAGLLIGIGLAVARANAAARRRLGAA